MKERILAGSAAYILRFHFMLCVALCMVLFFCSHKPQHLLKKIEEKKVNRTEQKYPALCNIFVWHTHSKKHVGGSDKANGGWSFVAQSPCSLCIVYNCKVRIRLCVTTTFFDCLNEFEWRNNIYFRVGILAQIHIWQILSESGFALLLHAQSYTSRIIKLRLARKRTAGLGCLCIKSINGSNTHNSRHSNIVQHKRLFHRLL